MKTPAAAVGAADDSEEVMDLQGLLCPLPVLKAGKRLQSMRQGQVLVVVASDPMAAVDIPHFCREQGHELLSQSREGGQLHFKIRRR